MLVKKWRYIIYESSALRTATHLTSTRTRARQPTALVLRRRHLREGSTVHSQSTAASLAASELLHRRLKQRCNGGGTPKQPTHHVPFCFEEYVYTIQGVRRAEAMGRSQMPPLSLWLKGSETEPNAKSVPTSSHRNSFTHPCDHDQGKSC